MCRAKVEGMFPWCIKRIGNRQEDGKDTMEDKLLNWGRLQELIDELGGENGLSSLIEILARKVEMCSPQNRNVEDGSDKQNTKLAAPN